MRVNRFSTVAAAAVSAALAWTPVAAVAESLPDALVSAYRQSGLLTQQRALLRATDEDFAVAIAATRPVFAYAFQAGWRQTRTPTAVVDATTASMTLTASFILYDFQRTAMGIDLARENVLMARDALIGVEQAALLRAVQAFLNVRSAHETAMLQGNNVRLITEELRAARDRFEVGEITQTDVSAAEAALAAAKSAEAAARGQLMIAREEYKISVGHYPDGLQVPPAVPMTARSLAGARSLARRNHPDILAAQRAVTVAEIAAEIARRSMLPTAKAEASASQNFSSASTTPFTSNLGVTVGVSGPIYQGGKLSALYRKAKAQADAARAALLLAVQGVEQQVSNAWAQLAVAGASLQATEQQIRASRVALRGAREEATLGARTTLEVLSFEQDLLDAQAARISAQSDQYLAVYQLLAAMGLLTADHLHLGLVGYDPEAYFGAVKNAPVHDVSAQGKRLDDLLATIARTRD